MWSFSLVFYWLGDFQLENLKSKKKKALMMFTEYVDEYIVIKEIACHLSQFVKNE